MHPGVQMMEIKKIEHSASQQLCMVRLCILLITLLIAKEFLLAASIFCGVNSSQWALKIYIFLCKNNTLKIYNLWSSASIEKT